MVSQLVMSPHVKFFGETISKLWNLRLGEGESYNPEEDTLFWGNYTGYDSTVINCHRGKGILAWAGSDLLDENNINRIRGTDIRHIAISKWIDRKLTARGIPHEYKILPTTDINYWTPEKLGNKVYAYAPDMPIYRRYLVDELAKEVPFEFIITDHAEQYSKQELRERYKECFIGLRLTWWDGCATTVQEMGLMGRRSVWNGEVTQSLSWKTRQDVIQLIMQESKNIGKLQNKLAKSVYNELNTGSDWLRI